MLDRGILDQARRPNRKPAQGIEELKEGVEKAAESVLGDEDEALRRAPKRSNDLADELDEEIRRADPDAAPTARPQPGDQQADRRSDRATGSSRPSSPATKQQHGGPHARASGSSGAHGRASRDGDNHGQRRAAASRKRVGRAAVAAPRATGQPAPGQRSWNVSSPHERANGGPITGDDSRWSDRLRDVEEMVDDPEMRAEAARIRDARPRHPAAGPRRFQAPKWDLVRELVAEPLTELRDRVAEELLRRSKETLVPIDRDPVPPKYAEQVRRYYEAAGEVDSDARHRGLGIARLALARRRLAASAAAVLVWGYRRAPASLGVRLCASALKALGIAALALCLLEPLFSGTRPRPGANLFVVLADDSQSLEIRDPGATQSRARVLRRHLRRRCSLA